MNDNWSEIIEILRPIIETSYTKSELKKAVETCLRMIGWKTSNKSMLSDYQTESGKIIDLVLGEKLSDGDFFPVLPIAILQEDAHSKSVIFENMDVLSSKIGLSISNNIEIYYKHDNDIPSCVCKIAYNVGDENGSNLLECLDARNFKEEKFEKFVEELYKNINPEDRLNEIVSLLISDKSYIKRIIEGYLISKGFDAATVRKRIEDFPVLMCDKNALPYEEPKIIVSESLPKYVSTTQHDTTRFSIDGINYLSKRNFVLAVVKRYVSEHEFADYDELEKVFPSKIISKTRGVIRPLNTVKEWMKTQPDLQKRYCMKPNEIIRLKNGMDIVVHNQWGANTFPSFLSIAQRLYNVTSNKPYNDLESKEELTVNEGIGISISEQSLETFSKKK